MSITGYSCQILMAFGFLSTDFRKNTQISNLMKVRPEGAEVFHVDRGTDSMTKLIVAFRNFSNAPKAGDTLSSRHVSSCDVTRAVGM
jgi:hypothetical protein